MIPIFFIAEARLIMAEGSMFQSRLDEVLRTYPNYVKYSSTPTKLNDYLYIGGYTDARNVKALQSCGITHVLNCAAFRDSIINPYALCTGIIEYKQFNANDDDNYDMIQHVAEAHTFICDAKNKGTCLWVIIRSNFLNKKLSIRSNAMG